jgi:hypothetical protein
MDAGTAPIHITSSRDAAKIWWPVCWKPCHCGRRRSHARTRVHRVGNLVLLRRVAVFDTTMIGGIRRFAAAEQRGTAYAREFRKKSEASGDPYLFRAWPLAALRAERGIWPME